MKGLVLLRGKVAFCPIGLSPIGQKDFFSLRPLRLRGEEYFFL
jgi:hypothetical protein